MRKLPLIGAAVAGFLVAFACLLPAQLLSYWLPSSIVVGTLSGSVWKGAADYLAIEGRPLGAVRWQVHPAALFLGQLKTDVAISSVDMNAHGEIVLKAGGGIQVRDLKLHSSLAALPSGAPIRWNGRLQADLRQLSFEGRSLREVLGTIDVHGLQAPPPDGLAIGSYRLSFDAASKQNERWIGKLQDLEGPLQVSGTLALGTQQDYLLEGLVVARVGAPEAISKTLRFLGPPDTQGRRVFSIAGTY